jgi:hypothetical protein
LPVLEVEIGGAGFLPRRQIGQFALQFGGFRFGILHLGGRADQQLLQARDILREIVGALLQLIGLDLALVDLFLDLLQVFGG